MSKEAQISKVQGRQAEECEDEEITRMATWNLGTRSNFSWEATHLSANTENQDYESLTTCMVALTRMTGSLQVKLVSVELGKTDQDKFARNMWALA